jgi:hypothetical protein
MLLLGQNEVNGPAAANVGARAADVIEDSLFRAAGFFQRVSKHGETFDVKLAPGQDAVVIGSLSEGHDRRCQRRGIEGDGAEGVADDVSKEKGLFLPLRFKQQKKGGIDGSAGIRLCLKSLPYCCRL